MSEDINSSEVEVVEEVNLQQLVDQLRKENAEKDKTIEAIAAKKEELLKETKAAKEEKRKQVELAEEAKKEKLSIAEKNGEFEQLFKQVQEDKIKLEQKIQQDSKERRDDRINNLASELANKIANDPKKAALLKRHVIDSISNVADEHGHVDADVINGIQNKFESDDTYSPLRASPKSLGGSAPGNTRGAGEGIKQLSLSEYSNMTPEQKLTFSKAVQAGKAQLI